MTPKTEDKLPKILPYRADRTPHGESRKVQMARIADALRAKGKSLVGKPEKSPSAHRPDSLEG